MEFSGSDRKALEISEVLINNKVDILGGQESWQSDNSKIDVPGYKMLW